MSDTPTNQFLFNFGIDEKRTHALTCRVTQIIAENLKTSDKSGSDVLRCNLDKSACVKDIVWYIDCEDLNTVEAQWMFFAFVATIANDDRLCEIARTKYAALRLFTTMGAPDDKFIGRFISRILQKEE